MSTAGMAETEADKARARRERGVVNCMIVFVGCGVYRIRMDVVCVCRIKVRKLLKLLLLCLQIGIDQGVYIPLLLFTLPSPILILPR